MSVRKNEKDLDNLCAMLEKAEIDFEHSLIDDKVVISIGDQTSFVFEEESGDLEEVTNEI